MIKTYKPYTSSIRTRKSLVRDVDNVRPHKKLTISLVGAKGRSRGRVSMRHQSAGARRHYRLIDFKRNKYDIEAKVIAVEYDPNRGPSIALISYADGEKKYILAPQGLEVGSVVVSGEKAVPEVGNSLPMKNIPLGAFVHNIEINPGQGGVLARGAGNSAQLMAKENGFVNLKMPSGEVKRISDRCYATMGVLSNMELRNVRLGKAGRNRHLGVRPAVRGVAMGNPKKAHPHAGSYKTTGIGMPTPKTKWGKPAHGVKTRRRNRTDYTIVKSRHSK